MSVWVELTREEIQAIAADPDAPPEVWDRLYDKLTAALNTEPATECRECGHPRDSHSPTGCFHYGMADTCPCPAFSLTPEPVEAEA